MMLERTKTTAVFVFYKPYIYYLCLNCKNLHKSFLLNKNNIEREAAHKPLFHADIDSNALYRFSHFNFRISNIQYKLHWNVMDYCTFISLY